MADIITFTGAIPGRLSRDESLELKTKAMANFKESLERQGQTLAPDAIYEEWYNEATGCTEFRFDNGHIL